MPKSYSNAPCDFQLAQNQFHGFLSSEGKALMGIRDFGEWKAYALQRFVGILHMTVQNSLKTNSPIPAWAASKVQESWNITGPDAAAGTQIHAQEGLAAGVAHSGAGA